MSSIHDGRTFLCNFAIVLNYKIFKFILRNILINQKYEGSNGIYFY
jgi:hypothetical protein